MRVLHHFTLWTFGLASPQTFYTSAECACLERHAAGRTRLAEIGCWHGVNTRRLRRAMHPDGVLFGIDPYAPGRLGFSAQRVISRHEVNKEVNGSIKWIRMTDIDAARWLSPRSRRRSISYSAIRATAGTDSVRRGRPGVRWSPPARATFLAAVGRPRKCQSRGRAASCSHARWSCMTHGSVSWRRSAC